MSAYNIARSAYLNKPFNTPFYRTSDIFEDQFNQAYMAAVNGLKRKYKLMKRTIEGGESVTS